MNRDHGLIAWFVGLFEGEGYIVIRRRGGVTVGITMTDLDVLERAASLFPSPGIRTETRPPRAKKTVYVWRIHDHDTVRQLLALIAPFLGNRRREKALSALQHLAGRKGIGSRQSREACRLTGDLSPYPAKVCEECGGSFKPRSIKEHRQRRFCSMSCVGLSRRHPPRICAVVGCPRERTRREWCDMHYQRVMKSGEPGEVAPRWLPQSGPCKWEGCEELKLKGHGRCNKHYQRMVKLSREEQVA